MNGALKSELYDLAASLPMVPLPCVEIVGALYLIVPVPEPRSRDAFGGLSILSQLREPHGEAAAGLP